MLQLWGAHTTFQKPHKNAKNNSAKLHLHLNLRSATHILHITMQIYKMKEQCKEGEPHH